MLVLLEGEFYQIHNNPGSTLFFPIASWSESERTAEQLVAHYRERGTFEDRLGEFNQAIGANLSSQSFE